MDTLPIWLKDAGSAVLVIVVVWMFLKYVATKDKDDKDERAEAIKLFTAHLDLQREAFTAQLSMVTERFTESQGEMKVQVTHLSEALNAMGAAIRDLQETVKSGQYGKVKS